MDKKDIRRRVKAQKSMLSDDERAVAAAKVFEMLEKSAAFMLADRILMYHSLPDELSTEAFIAKWHMHKHFFLPRVNGVELEVLPYDRSRLRLGAFHIEEPQGDDVVPVDQMELIVVPAVAYDRSGNRVGRGKGYYDRMLSSAKAMTVGVGYDFQLVDEIDTEDHDVPVDMVITESHCITVRNRRR